MSINKLVAGAKGELGNSNGADVAASVNGLIDANNSTSDQSKLTTGFIPYLNPVGADSHASFDEVVLDGEFSIPFTIIPEGTQRVILGHSTITNNFVYLRSDGTLRLRILGSSFDSAVPLTLGEMYYGLYRRDANDNITLSLNGSIESLGSNSAILTLDQSGAGGSLGFAEDFNGFLFNISFETLTSITKVPMSIDNTGSDTETIGDTTTTYDGIPYYTRFRKPLTPTQNITGYDIILLAGQSNMVGRGQNVNADIDTIDFRILQYADALSAVTLARDPLYNLDGSVRTVGMGMTIARNHLNAIPSNRGVILIPSADGGTGFSDGFWQVGGTGYNTAVANTNLALNYKGLDNKIVAMCWHQGEKDMSLTETQYTNEIDAMISGLRSEINGDSSSTPFIVGEVPTWSTEYGAGVDAALRDTPNRNSSCAWVETSDLTGKGDSLHFDVVSQRLLGGRYYEKLELLL